MPLIQILAAVAAGAGEPSLRPGLDADQVSPGPWGFFFTFGLAAVVVFLIWDMSRRIRRVRYRAQVESGGQDSPAGGAEASGQAGPAGGGARGYADGGGTEAGSPNERSGRSGRPDRRE